MIFFLMMMLFDFLICVLFDEWVIPFIKFVGFKKPLSLRFRICSLVLPNLFVDIFICTTILAGVGTRVAPGGYSSSSSSAPPAVHRHLSGVGIRVTPGGSTFRPAKPLSSLPLSLSEIRTMSPAAFKKKRRSSSAVTVAPAAAACDLYNLAVSIN